jgi:hypothetical protein
MNYDISLRCGWYEYVVERAQERGFFGTTRGRIIHTLTGLQVMDLLTENHPHFADRSYEDQPLDSIVTDIARMYGERDHRIIRRLTSRWIDAHMHGLRVIGADIFSEEFDDWKKDRPYCIPARDTSFSPDHKVKLHDWGEHVVRYLQSHDFFGKSRSQIFRAMVSAYIVESQCRDATPANISTFASKWIDGHDAQLHAIGCGKKVTNVLAFRR